jgi:hypothetical protein
MSSRANPESVRIFDRPMAAQASVSSLNMDSGTVFRDKQCEVIVTDEGQAAASSGVWVLEAAICEA